MSGIGRASVLIGAGTIVSRLTGFLRNILLVAVVGSVASRAGDAFTNANQLPNNLYALISTGLLTAVVVPQIVKAAAHPDEGRAFISKLFTLGTTVLIASTVVATLAAPGLVQLYANQFTPDQMRLSTAFAYWCMPQIFFYGFYSLLGETLNARRVFGPYTWAPIVNNIVSGAGFALFIVLFGGPLTSVDDWTPEMIALLGGVTTLGIVVQAVILLFFWRRLGLRLRPDFHWRGVGLGEVGRLAGWTFLMVVAGQFAGLIQSRVLSGASGSGPAATTSTYAWLLFMLPYSIIVLSIGTPYFTRLSEHAAAGRDDDVRRDVGRSIRTLGVFVVIAAAALFVASVPASRIFTDSAAEALAASDVLACFLVGLVPLAVLFVIQRTFYAYGDTRTPFYFTIVQCAVVIATALLAAAWLPLEQLAAGVALGQSFASILQVTIATILLHRRLGSIGVASWIWALVRFTIAAIPAAAAGWAVYVFVAGGADGWMTSDRILAALGAALIGVVCLVVYAGALAVMRAPELGPAIGMVRRMLPGHR